MGKSKQLIGLYNETLKGLRIISGKKVNVSVATDIAKAFLNEIDDLETRAVFVDWLFEHYTITL